MAPNSPSVAKRVFISPRWATTWTLTACIPVTIPLPPFRFRLMLRRTWSSAVWLSGFVVALCAFVWGALITDYYMSKVIRLIQEGGLLRREKGACRVLLISRISGYCLNKQTTTWQLCSYWSGGGRIHYRCFFSEKFHSIIIKGEKTMIVTMRLEGYFQLTVLTKKTVEQDCISGWKYL